MPTSLFAAITDTRTVRSVIASAITIGEIHPCSSHGTMVTSQPSRANRLNGSSTALCSLAAVTRCLPREVEACATPLMARLFDSVAPEVKMISRGLARDGAGDLLAGVIDGLAGLPTETSARCSPHCRIAQ